YAFMGGGISWILSSMKDRPYSGKAADRRNPRYNILCRSSKGKPPAGLLGAAQREESFRPRGLLVEDMGPHLDRRLQLRGPDGFHIAGVKMRGCQGDVLAGPGQSLERHLERAVPGLGFARRIG